MFAHLLPASQPASHCLSGGGAKTAAAPLINQRDDSPEIKGITARPFGSFVLGLV